MTLIKTLLALSFGGPFMILLDYHKGRGLLTAAIYISCFFSLFFILGFLVDWLGFNLLYFVFMLPALLFVILIMKNRR